MCTIDTVHSEEQVYLIMRVDEILRVKQLHSRFTLYSGPTVHRRKAHRAMQYKLGYITDNDDDYCISIGHDSIHSDHLPPQRPPPTSSHNAYLKSTFSTSVLSAKSPAASS